MGFQNIGCPAGKEFTGNSIKQYLKVYFPQWLNTYNFENYTNFIFNAEINNTKVNLDLLQDDQQQYLLEKKKAKNSFVTAELLNLGHFIEWIEKAFINILETTQDPDFFRYKQWFEANDGFYSDSTQKFLLDLKSKTPLSAPQFDDIIFNKIDSLSKDEATYFLTLMYLDFVKIQGFLHSKFEPIPKEKPKQFQVSDKKYNHLKDIFIYPNSYDACVRVLKTVDPPILNIENKYIGNEKSAFVLWIDILKRHNLIVKTENDKVYSQLISNEFHPFSISEGLFRKTSKRAKEKYDTEFNHLLSQVYQSVKT